MPLYQFKDGTKIIGGLQIQIEGHSSGDLTVGSGGDSVGDPAGGVGIGDTDITIWGGEAVWSTVQEAPFRHLEKPQCGFTTTPSNFH